MYNLCIDVGNSFIKTGLFHAKELVEQMRFAKGETKKISNYLTNQKVKKVIFSKVVDTLPKALEDYLGTQAKVLELDSSTLLPIENLYKTPQTLGKDRLAAILGAHALFPGTHCLVVDSGTCITFDFLNAGGQYLGGNISPGWEMRLDAMQHFTAQLPRPKAQLNKNWVGDTTQTALQNGAYYGLLFEIEGYIQQIEEKYGTVNVLLTGGNTDFFAKNLKSQIFVNQNLVLIGLNKILNYNV